MCSEGSRGGSARQSGGVSVRQAGPAAARAERKAEVGRDGGGVGLGRGAEAGIPGPARGPWAREALGPAKPTSSAPRIRRRPRPSPSPARSFKPPSPSPFSSPMRSRPRAAAAPLPALRPASSRGRPPPGTPACWEVIKSGAPYLSSPGLNRSPSPPSPPRSAITEGRVHPPADSASPIGRTDHQSLAIEAEILGIYEMIGGTFHQF